MEGAQCMRYRYVAPMHAPAQAKSTDMTRRRSGHACTPAQTGHDSRVVCIIVAAMHAHREGLAAPVDAAAMHAPAQTGHYSRVVCHYFFLKLVVCHY